ncbi:uncharacterized protein At3g17950-like [Panicum virgatum]|uniref:Uncharacterized protein n=1 Tax=Panicum virgatum TaxID=38727 RepID=A0A8T0TMR3_PANVG|nr:uncharacterized protein At3g17950-like [Panicum virgatum]KAG2610365.1 hypothetical protein PVAP13_4KG188000 [Panicum virgatum]
MPWVLSARPHRRHGTANPQSTAPPDNCLPINPFASLRFASLQSPSASASGHHHYHDPAPFPTPGHAPLPQRAGSPDAMDLDADMIPTSPSADSSPSSSDLDTESTGSFFPDRSTTLGTLMGVSAFGGAQAQPQQRRAARAPAAAEEGAGGAQRAPHEDDEERRRGGVWRRRRRRRRRRRGRSLGGSWWRLCRDHGDGGPPTSLGEFLDMERQLAGADFLCDGTGASGREAAAAAAATALFEDGRVRPPQPAAAAAVAEERGRWRLLRASEGSSSLARLPVLLTGICSGGAG